MDTVGTRSPSPEELLTAIDQLDVSELRPFVSKVLARTARRLAPHFERRESELIDKINRALPPEVEKRFRELIAARQAENLSPVELEELVALTDRTERLQVERLKYLIELSQTRGVPLTDLMQELGIKPLPVE